MNAWIVNTFWSRVTAYSIIQCLIKKVSRSYQFSSRTYPVFQSHLFSEETLPWVALLEPSLEICWTWVKPRGPCLRDDFVKWYSTLKPPQPTIVGEALPAGVPTMASRYGVFGSKALMTGVPWWWKQHAKCLCWWLKHGQLHHAKATGECEELSELATKFEQGSNIARALALNAVNAMQVAQVLLRRVEKAAANLVHMPELSFPKCGWAKWPLCRTLVCARSARPHDSWPYNAWKSNAGRWHRWELSHEKDGTVGLRTQNRGVFAASRRK